MAGRRPKVADTALFARVAVAVAQREGPFESPFVTASACLPWCEMLVAINELDKVPSVETLGRCLAKLAAFRWNAALISGWILREADIEPVRARGSAYWLRRVRSMANGHSASYERPALGTQLGNRKPHQHFERLAAAANDRKELYAECARRRAAREFGVDQAEDWML